MSATKKAFTAALLITGTMLLAGCGDDAAPAAAPAATTTPPATVPVPSSTPVAAAAHDCTATEVGETVTSQAFAACVTDALDASAGYVASGTLLGEPATVRHEPARDAFEVTIQRGSIIGIGTDVWVRPAGGAWTVADSDAPDATVLALSELGIEAARALPGLTTGSVMGDLTVTDASDSAVTYAGDQTSGPISVSGTYVVAPDFALISAAVTATSTARELSLDLAVTAWDEPQNITAPL